MLKTPLVSFVLLATIGCLGSAFAQDLPVKIGILNDQASVYSAITGPGSVAAARLAIVPVRVYLRGHGPWERFCGRTHCCNWRAS